MNLLGSIKSWNLYIFSYISSRNTFFFFVFTRSHSNLKSLHFLTYFLKKYVLLFLFLNNYIRGGVVVITTAQLHSTKPELRFCAGSNPARGVSEIRDGEDLWQWSRLEIRLNAFRRSTIPQKQFIIIIINLSIFKTNIKSNIKPFMLFVQVIYCRHRIYWVITCFIN